MGGWGLLYIAPPRSMGPCFRRDDIWGLSTLSGNGSDIKDSSSARRAGLGKPLSDPHRQGVADFAIGLQLLLAVALGAGGIMGRPVFDVGGVGTRQFQRLVMRLRRQRANEVGIESFPSVPFLEDD